MTDSTRLEVSFPNGNLRIVIGDHRYDSRGFGDEEHNPYKSFLVFLQTLARLQKSVQDTGVKFEPQLVDDIVNEIPYDAGSVEDARYYLSVISYARRGKSKAAKPPAQVLEFITLVDGSEQVVDRSEHKRIIDAVLFLRTRRGKPIARF